MVGLFMLGLESQFMFFFLLAKQVNYVAIMYLAATTSQERQTRAQKHSVTLHACDVFPPVITLFVAPSVTNETKLL